MSREVTGRNLKLTAVNGNIGTADRALKVKADTLDADAAKNIWMKSIGSTTVNHLTAPESIQFTATDKMTARSNRSERSTCNNQKTGYHSKTDRGKHQLLTSKRLRRSWKPDRTGAAGESPDRRIYPGQQQDSETEERFFR